MHNGLEDVLLWDYTLHVLDQLKSLLDLFVFQIVNHEVKSGLRNDFNKRWKHLESVFSSSEYNKVVSEEIIILECVSYRGRVLEHFQFCFGCLSVVQLVMIAGFQVHTHYRIWVKTQVDCENIQAHVVVVHLVVA